ncbi:MAG: biotin--[acetyl-CoA-carboxylase] ligase [Firmicutes bacterium]|nr:biotin--[acetyl-CoA-carboxylase] ligase [Bacillota bacterium]
MNIQEIRNNLTTKYIGQNIIYFDKIDSTQKEAKKLAENDLPNGSIIIADMQTAGIGTHGRTWHTSANKNIIMTVVIYPNCNVYELEGITTKIADAAVSAIWNLYNIKLEIEEPNDIVLNNKKAGGILTETKVDGGIAKNLFIGIGFNVNEEDFPEDIIDTATSLKKELGKEFDREIIIAGILNELEKIIPLYGLGKN